MLTVIISLIWAVFLLIVSRRLFRKYDALEKRLVKIQVALGALLYDRGVEAMKTPTLRAHVNAVLAKEEAPE